MAGHKEPVFQDSKGKITNQIEANEESVSLSPNSGERICPVLGEFAEWEIPWEDLQIGERIGIGKISKFEYSMGATFRGILYLSKLVYFGRMDLKCSVDLNCCKSSISHNLSSKHMLSPYNSEASLVFAGKF